MAWNTKFVAVNWDRSSLKKIFMILDGAPEAEHEARAIWELVKLNRARDAMENNYEHNYENGWTQAFELLCII